MPLVSLGTWALLAVAPGCAGADTDPSPPPAVWFNEVNADPDVSVLRDWFEIVNLSAGPVDLTGWQVRDDELGEPVAFTFEAGTTIQPGAFQVVLARRDAGPIEDYQVAQFQLGKDGDCLAIDDPNGSRVDTVCWDRGQAATLARIPDGGDWTSNVEETPGAPNLP